MPYWRLSAFYFFYFAALGAFVPYWSLFLQADGLDAAQIGQIMAVPSATKVISPNLWGWLAERSGQPLRIIRWASWLQLTSFCLIFWADGFNGLFLATLCFSFFWNAPLPLFEALTLEHLHHNSVAYSHIRLWGSVGFIVAVLLVGRALEGDLALPCLPIVVVALFGLLWAVSLSVPASRGAVGETRAAPLGTLLFRTEVLAFFGVCLLQQLGHGPYYVFFSMYLEDQGFGKSETGQLWTLGVLAEIALFAVIHRFLRAYSLRRILIVSLCLSGIRWLTTAWLIDYLAAIVFAQVLHAASFGAFHAAAIHFVHHYFKGPSHAQGQALYSSLSFGLGGALGSLYAGQLWEEWGPHGVYSVAAVSSLLGAWVAWRYVGKGLRTELTA